MSTKLNPGPRDFYAELEPDEEFIIFGSHSITSPMMGRLWAMIRQQQINMGIYPASEREQVRGMLDTVTRMEIQYRERYQKKEHMSMEFDSLGYPLTGQHRKLDSNTTSGANDERSP